MKAQLLAIIVCLIMTLPCNIDRSVSYVPYQHSPISGLINQTVEENPERSMEESRTIMEWKRPMPQTISELALHENAQEERFYEKPGYPLAQCNNTTKELPPGVPYDWWANVQESIRLSEYQITWQENTCIENLEASYQAPNRAQNLRTFFTETGILVVPRTEPMPSWSFSIKLTDYGYAADMRRVQSANPSVACNRVEYARNDILEWYINEERGLEQGFTIFYAPQNISEAIHDELVLSLVFSGNLRPVMTEEGCAIEFVNQGGVHVLRYSDLHVTDSAGKELHAYLSLSNTNVLVKIDDTGAIYPIMIDPLLTSPSWTAEGNQAGALFGRSVSTAGDVNGDGYGDVIVGASGYDSGEADEGRVYVYHGSATGLDTSPSWWAESNNTAAAFGYAVGTAGDVNGDGYSDIIVGAPNYTNVQTSEGKAYVYRGSINGLITGPIWMAEGQQEKAGFGYSVGTAGDVNGDGYSDIIIGAPDYDNGQTDEGCAFVYHGSVSGPSVAPDWMGESNQTPAGFGFSAGTAGDVNGDGYADIIVGAPNYTNGQTTEGRAYVYHGAASGLSSIPDWTTESNQFIAYLGRSVGTAGDINGDGYSDVVVGMPYESYGAGMKGGVHVYCGSDIGLNLDPEIVFEGEQIEDFFGHSVGTAGDVNGDGYADIIVGAPNLTNGEATEGRAYVYLGSASGFGSAPDWITESDQSGANYGCSVGTAGDVNGDGFSDIIIGARGYDGIYDNAGRAYVYHGSSGSVSTSAAWTIESNQNSAYLGYSIATAGDVNGDGYADVIVGAYNYDHFQDDEGIARVYHGSAAGLSTTPNWWMEGNQDYAYFGFSVGTAGDVNGDGYDDVIVGAPNYDCVQNDEGRVFVCHGSASGLNWAANWTADGSHSGSDFGRSVGTAGDVNGDGYADVIIGARYYTNGQSGEGQACVFHGSKAGLSLEPEWTLESNQAGANLGYSVGTAGDVNGDGYSDVIVGAPNYDNGQIDEGSAYVCYGSDNGLALSPKWTAEGNQEGAYFGFSVGTAGDVNADGYSDVIVGAPYYDNGHIDEGCAYVYHGSLEGLKSNFSWWRESNEVGANYGISVGTAGDVNGDGYADVFVSAPQYNDKGRVFIYHGFHSSVHTSPDSWIEGNQDYSDFGLSVGTAGDVNGDGYADVIVGAPYYDNPQTDEGSAFLYCGNSGSGISLNPRQRRSDDNSPIARLGRSDLCDSFRLALLGRTPFGRSKTKLQWEVKLLGTPFNGAGLHESVDWTDADTAGAQMSELVTGLSPDALYHWRVRLHYHPAITPFRQYGRWLTMPWNGWQEADLRTGKRPVIYVDADASGNNNGLSWIDAYNHLQDALTESQPYNDIWVAEGTYKPDEGVGYVSGDPDASFHLKNGVEVYGGFAGVEEDLDKRDCETYKTTLSGEIGDTGSILDNSHHVVNGSGTDGTAILDGFTITAGNANGSYSSADGGGIYCDDGDPMVRNCTITGNIANDDGGGVFCKNSSIAILSSMIDDNFAGTNGGGMYCNEGSPAINHCVIADNLAELGGGGIFGQNADPELDGCVISGNTATQNAGGIYLISASNYGLTNCMIVDNSAGLNGGGMMCYLSDIVITNSTFSDNSAISKGGAIYCLSSSPSLTDCIIWGDNPTEIYVASGAPVLNYCDIKGGWSGIGSNNFDSNPLFVRGALHKYYLSQIESGQAINSPCKDAGSDKATNLGFDALTTRSDGMPDEGIVDMGYHTHYTLWIYSFTRSGNDITVYWNAVPGIRYVVEWSENMSSWTQVLVGQAGEWTDINAGVYTKKFYRVREE